MIAALSLVVVALAGFYFIALGVSALLVPARASRFLAGFAGSSRAHYLELMLRLVVGGALIVGAPRMLFPVAFSVFGWVLVVTTGGLLLVPWQWHQRFAQRTVPAATRYLAAMGLFSLALGGCLWVALFLGRAV